mgnify:CR=1 FL=1
MRFVMVVVMMLILSVYFPISAQEVIVTTCDFESLQEALNSQATTITFDCSGEIIFDDFITVFGNKQIDGGGDVAFDGNRETLLFVVNIDASLIVDGVTFQNGKDADAGAILNYGNVSIFDSTFVHNRALNGGAITNAGQLSITNSKFDGNRAEDDVQSLAGAIFNAEGSNITITNTTFLNNFASYGGAIFNIGNLTVSESTAFDNEAEFSGGVVYNFGGGVATIQDSLFFENQAFDGGALVNDNGTLTITTSEFSDNTVESDGGVLYNMNDGAVTVFGSTFRGNSASFVGAIYNTQGEVAIFDSTFYQNNSYTQAGAIYNNDILNITNSTFVENSANDRGGAVYTFGQNTIVTITHSTFVNNTDSGGMGAIYSYGTTTVSDSIITGEEGQCGGLSPILADDTNLANHACGDSVVMNDLLLGEFNGKFVPLLPDSPALDAIDAPCEPENDQIGTTRPQGEKCDIGAVEMP